ncbi:MAG: hypothetical protein LBK26_02105 [Rickettsiales bacterium]|nr:hypothetical protein [Rickettsiales bacterium]
MDPYNDGYCDYINTCTTPTHCKSGYYKDGNTCKECPEKSSGATSPYLNVGPVDVCYKIIDPVSGTDSAGTFNYTNITNGNQCKYSL